MADTPYRLPGDAAGHDQQDDRICESSEDRAAAQPIGKTVARPTAAQHSRTPGQRETENVAEVVPGIGEQCERPGEDPGDRLAGDIKKVEGNPDREGTAIVQMGRLMAVPMRLPVVIVLHVLDHSGNSAGSGDNPRRPVYDPTFRLRSFAYGADRGRRVSTRDKHFCPAHGELGGFRAGRCLAALCARAGADRKPSKGSTSRSPAP